MHKNNTFIAFSRRLIFLHNDEGILGAFKEKIMILFTNVIGLPKKVDNDCTGHFNLNLEDILQWTWRFPQKINLKDHVFDEFMQTSERSLLKIAALRKAHYKPHDLGIKLREIRKTPGK